MDCDVLVYGGTAAGVVAAVTVAAGGRRVVLVEPGRHVGGMTSGGLGWTDFGHKRAVGGRAQGFYRRVGDHYERTLGTRTFTEQNQFRKGSWANTAGEPDDGTCYVFEPSVAEAVLEQMIAEAGPNLRVLREHRVRTTDVTDGQIERVHLDIAPAGAFNEPGESVTGSVTIEPRFCIDCSYEGDLLASAGCGFRVGREANSVFGETLNGIAAETHKHQVHVPVDPYRTAGDPDSGLIAYVSDEPFGEPGGGDTCLQAYNLRLCLTQRDDLRLPITPADDHDPADFELVRRFVTAADATDDGTTLTRHLKLDPVPNGKTDVNNQGGVSTDFIGQNHAYATADYAERGRLWRTHLRWIRGLLHTLAHDPQVPAHIREEMGSWGLCRDEFTDTGGWSHQLYVREARRLVGLATMTEHHCTRRETIDDPVGLAAYQMDSHNCRRLVIDGRVQNEGDVQVPPTGPYPISYRALVPASGATRNLLVPVCCSASHIAFGSIRMEPVFMVLGESAALAALACLETEAAAAELPYDKLAQALADAGQVCTFDE
ncbi:MAG: FAD-dependent oxidoreductase [Planctomycetota bacterium]